MLSKFSAFLMVTTLVTAGLFAYAVFVDNDSTIAGKAVSHKFSGSTASKALKTVPVISDTIEGLRGGADCGKGDTQGGFNTVAVEVCCQSNSEGECTAVKTCKQTTQTCYHKEDSGSMSSYSVTGTPYSCGQCGADSVSAGDGGIASTLAE